MSTLENNCSNCNRRNDSVCFLTEPQNPESYTCGKWQPVPPDDLLFGTLHADITFITSVCHDAAKHWWKDNQGNDIRDNPLTFSNKLMLIVSEVAEAMEGDRKNKMDDHLPHRPMREVELADALIRICDLAGGYNLDLAGAVVEKLAYNAKRADHKPENRRAEGGKTY